MEMKFSNIDDVFGQNNFPFCQKIHGASDKVTFIHSLFQLEFHEFAAHSLSFQTEIKSQQKKDAKTLFGK